MKTLMSFAAKAGLWLMRATNPSWPNNTDYPDYLMPLYAAISRDITPIGIKAYSICGGCGERLDFSATLCSECSKAGNSTGFYPPHDDS